MLSSSLSGVCQPSWVFLAPAVHFPSHLDAAGSHHLAMSSPPNAPKRWSPKFGCQKKDAKQEQEGRRRAYLNKVKERGEDRRFETRQDQVRGATALVMWPC